LNLVQTTQALSRIPWGNRFAKPRFVRQCSACADREWHSLAPLCWSHAKTGFRRRQWWERRERRERTGSHEGPKRAL